MEYTEYKNAASFLAATQELLEESEAINGLMYGLALRLRENLLLYGTQPLFATIGNKNALDIIVLMTPPHKLQVMTTHRVSEAAFVLLAKELFEREWPVPGVVAAKEVAQAFAHKWSAISGRGNRVGARQRIYELREVNPPEYPRGMFRQATSEDIELASEWTSAFITDCCNTLDVGGAMELIKEKVSSGSIFFWDLSGPVSMAARTRPTPNGESVSLVYTPSSFRRKGYATAVVSRLSQRILDEGKQLCTLYTDLSNPTSNSIYKKIGYSPVADVIDIHFDE